MRCAFVGKAVVMSGLVAALLASPRAWADDSYYLDKLWDTPDYTQTDPAYGGFPDNDGVLHGYCFCGPTAGSNGLMWLADHGFPNLANDSGDRKKDQHDLIADYAQPEYMDAYESNGVGITNFCRGIKNWIHDHGYEYNRLLFQGYCSCDPEFYAGTLHPDLDWGRQALREQASMVILNVGWFAYDEETDDYDEVGGHYMTLAGYGHDGHQYNPDYLIAHDPAPRAGTSFHNDYALPERIESGTLNGNRSAVGYYKLTDGIAVPSKADFCILRGIIVLEMIPDNYWPVAEEDAYSGQEDSRTIVYRYEGVLDNDYDRDWDPMEACIVSGPAHGTLDLWANGALVYIPDENYHGTDSFTYQAYDGQDYSKETTVTLEIASVNDAPIAVDDEYAVDQDGRLIVYSYDGVLDNDTDADNLDLDTEHDDTLTAVLQSGPSNGTIDWYSNGAFVYNPDSGFCGTDSFTYQVFDGTEWSDVADVLLEVLAGAVPVPGDATGNGVVDEADMAVVNDYWGEKVSGGASMGDFNDDGKVDAVDASILAANWGDHRENAALAAVPEPSSFVLLLSLCGLGGTGLLSRRRRYR